jgi:hypothetical protein
VVCRSVAIWQVGHYFDRNLGRLTRSTLQAHQASADLREQLREYQQNLDITATVKREDDPNTPGGARFRVKMVPTSGIYSLGLRMCPPLRPASLKCHQRIVS